MQVKSGSQNEGVTTGTGNDQVNDDGGENEVQDSVGDSQGDQSVDEQHDYTASQGDTEANQVMEGDDNLGHVAQEEEGMRADDNEILAASQIKVEMPEQVIETSTRATFDEINDELNPIPVDETHNVMESVGSADVGVAVGASGDVESLDMANNAGGECVLR